MPCSELAEYAFTATQECFVKPKEFDDASFCSLTLKDRALVMWESMGDFQNAFKKGNEVACKCTEDNYG